MNQRMLAVSVAALLSAGTTAYAADQHTYIDPAARNPGMSSWPAPGDISPNMIDDRPGDYFAFQRPLIRRTDRGAAEFSALDVDHRGYLTQDQLNADPRYAGTLPSLDRNGDGRVEVGEFSAFQADTDIPVNRAIINWPPPNVAQRVLDDRPGDYFAYQRPLITRTPDVHASRFQALDTNHDGVVSQAELDADPMLANRNADLSGAGGLDLAEFSALEENSEPTRHPGAESNWPPPPADASHPNPVDMRPGDYFAFVPPVAGQGLR